MNKKQFLAIGIHAIALLVISISARIASAETVEEVAPYKINATLSYDFNRGNFGGIDAIKSWTASTTVELDYDNFNFSLALPIVRQFGPVGEIIVAGKPLIVHGKPVLRNGKVVTGPGKVLIVEGSSQGLGDANLGVMYFLPNAHENEPLFDIRAAAKLDTGDRNQGLGSGATDYSVQVDASQVIAGFTVAGTLGYTKVGQIPEAKLRNYIFASLDCSKHITEFGKVGAIWNYAQSAASGASDAQDLTIYYSYEIKKSLRMQAYVLKGLQKGSPDQGAGISANIAF